MIRSVSGLSPVISMSIQMRRDASWGIADSRKMGGRILAHYGTRRPARPIVTVTAFAFAVLFVAALALSLAVRLWLARRHVAFVAAHRDAVPPAFADRIGLAAHQKAADYTIARMRLGVAETARRNRVARSRSRSAAASRRSSRVTDVLPFGILGRDLLADRRRRRDLGRRQPAVLVSADVRHRGEVRLQPDHAQAVARRSRQGRRHRRGARPAARGARDVADARRRPVVVALGLGRRGSASSSCCWRSIRRSSRRSSTSSRRCPRARRATRSRRCSRAAASRTAACS